MHDRSERLFPIILIIPALAIVFFLVIFPLVWALGLSFHSYNVLRGGEPIFVGLGNYIKLLNDPFTWERFVTTATFVVSAVSLEFLLGFGLALIFSEDWGKLELYKCCPMKKLKKKLEILNLNSTHFECRSVFLKGKEERC
jgi:ABC-type sugar transport system permease subunit